jgi:hypothetical protein
MINDWELHCWNCHKTDCVTSSNAAPEVGDIEICRFCGKANLITWASVQYSTKPPKDVVLDTKTEVSQ